MLAYLTCAPSRTASRAILVDLFWADGDELAGRHGLRTTLWEIRRRLGLDVVITDGDMLRLSSSITCDRDLFLHSVQNAEHSAAVAAYHGEFMPGFAAPGCGDFEQWADLERRQLRIAFVRSAEMAARRALESAHWREAQRFARQARDADTGNERTWRLLLETLLSGGDSVEAAMEALRLQRTWADDERDLEPDTIRFVTIALGDRGVSPHISETTEETPRRLSPELVGRASEFATLLHAWERVGASRGSHFHVEAPPGLGKTRLLEEVHRRLRATRARVVMVSAALFDRDLSYSLASDIAGSLGTLRGARGISRDSAGALIALNPSLAAVFDATADSTLDEEALRRRALAVEELLTAVAEERPLALLVDDAHWADATSLRMLRRLMRRAREVPCLLVTAGRPGSALALSTEAGSILELRPLGVLEVTELVTSLAALPEEPWTAALADDLSTTSRGSPLVIIETLAHLCDTGVLRLDERKWRCDDPSRLREIVAGGAVLRRRAASLPALESSLMLALATLGSSAELSLLGEVTSTDESAAFASLTRLERDGLVRRSHEGRWACAHDEIAAAVVDEATTIHASSALAPLSAMHTRIATIYLREMHSATALRRAGMHALAAGDDPLLIRALQQWASLRSAEGDRRDTRTRVREFLGAAADDDGRVSTLASSLPRSRPRWYAGAAAIAAALLISAFLLPRLGAARAQHHATVSLVGQTSNGHRPTVSVSLDAGVAELPPALALDRTGDRVPLLPRPGNPGEIAFTKSLGDSGEHDVYIASAEHVRRVTFAPGDDNVSDWSPDGRQLLASTGRWDPDFYVDLAIIDAVSGSTRALVRTRGKAETMARWSPDGTRIAFVRREIVEMEPDRVCTIGADGLGEHCIELPGHTGLQLAAWRGIDNLLVAADSNAVHRLLEIDLSTDRAKTLETRNGEIFVSPGGDWEICYCVDAGAKRRIWLLSRTGVPQEARPIPLPATLTALGPLWNVPQIPALARVRISSTAEAIPLDQTFAAEAEGEAVGGSRMQLRALRWSSSDTSIAVVDTTGRILPRRTGRFVLHASAGGWASDSLSMVIGAPSATLLWHAGWAHDSNGWRDVAVFGEPKPEPYRDGQTWSFFNHGDGSFSSGAYSRAQWRTKDGLSLETSIRLLRNHPVWQSISIGLIGNLTEAAIASWDHRTNGPPLDAVLPQCVLSVPAAEGKAAIGTMGLNTETESRVVAAPSSVRSGNWAHMRLDVHADGSCTLAIDGIRVASVIGIARPVPRRFITYGQSKGTRALVGPVDVWSGIRGATIGVTKPR